MTYLVKNSPIHGKGLFAAQWLKAGEVVAEYQGERLDKAESARRQATANSVYIFEINDSYDLDGDVPDNPVKFANHSCEPNCEMILEAGRLFLRTVHEIKIGEELTFDYGFRLAAFPGHQCMCGAPSCAGFIIGSADRWRARRLLNRPGRSLLDSTREVGA